MQVLSEAIPMTNGEVYALIRRRRDERNAALHPPFGLQPLLSDNHLTLQQQPPRRTVSFAAGSAASAMSGGSNSVQGRAVAADALDSVAAAAAASTANLVAAPSSGHLVVLLTEVTVLNYLANHSSLLHDTSVNVNALNSIATAAAEGAAAAAINASPAAVLTHTLRDVYGPASVYDKVVAEALPASGVHVPPATIATASKDSGSNSAPAHLCSAADVLTDPAQIASYYAALAGHRPGSKGHVKAVAELLDQYDEAGKAQERIYAAGIRRVVQQLLQLRLWTPLSDPHFPIRNDSKTEDPAPQHGMVKAEKREDEGEERRGEVRMNDTFSTGDKAEASGADTQKKLMLNEAAMAAEAANSNTRAVASAPLLLEPSPLWGTGDPNNSTFLCSSSMTRTGGNANTATDGGAKTAVSSSVQQQQQQVSRSLLSAAEVLQLVVGRPQRPLDVYRLLDDVDARLQYNEEAITAFVEGVIAVFGGELP